MPPAERLRFPAIEQSRQLMAKSVVLKNLKGSLDPNSKASIFFCDSRGGIKIYDMDDRRVDLSVDSDVEMFLDLIRRRGGRRYNT